MFNINFKPFSINFLLEASIESIEKNNEEKLLNLLGHSKHKSWTDYIASNFDPTYPKQNKYTLWMINGLLRKQFDLNDLSNAKSVLDHFDKNSKFYPKQLTQYKTIQDIENDSSSVISSKKEEKSKKTKSLLSKYADGTNNELLYSEGDDWILVSHTAEGNALFKSISSWCTSRDATMFINYTKDNNKLFVFYVNSKLYQFQFDGRKAGMIADSNDILLSNLAKCELIQYHLNILDKCRSYFKFNSPSIDTDQKKYWQELFKLDDSLLNTSSQVLDLIRNKDASLKEDINSYIHDIKLGNYNDVVEPLVISINGSEISIDLSDLFINYNYILDKESYTKIIDLGFRGQILYTSLYGMYKLLDYKEWAEHIRNYISNYGEFPNIYFYTGFSLIGKYFIPLSYIFSKDDNSINIKIPEQILNYYLFPYDGALDIDMFFNKARDVVFHKTGIEAEDIYTFDNISKESPLNIIRFMTAETHDFSNDQIKTIVYDLFEREFILNDIEDSKAFLKICNPTLLKSILVSFINTKKYIPKVFYSEHYNYDVNFIILPLLSEALLDYKDGIEGILPNEIVNYYMLSYNDNSLIEHILSMDSNLKKIQKLLNISKYNQNLRWNNSKLSTINSIVKFMNSESSDVRFRMFVESTLIDTDKEYSLNIWKLFANVFKCDIDDIDLYVKTSRYIRNTDYDEDVIRVIQENTNYPIALLRILSRLLIEDKHQNYVQKFLDKTQETKNIITNYIVDNNYKESIIRKYKPLLKILYTKHSYHIKSNAIIYDIINGNDKRDTEDTFNYINRLIDKLVYMANSGLMNIDSDTTKKAVSQFDSKYEIISDNNKSDYMLSMSYKNNNFIINILYKTDTKYFKMKYEFSTSESYYGDIDSLVSVYIKSKTDYILSSQYTIDDHKVYDDFIEFLKLTMAD